jgi:hypothetical protein
MRILEIGECPYVSTFLPGRADFYSVARTAGPEKRLTLRRILLLEKRLKKGDYDFVVYHVAAKVVAPRHRNMPAWRTLLELLSGLFRFYKVSWHFFHHRLMGTETPLVVLDRQDVPRITETESRWLDRCRFWFMRELPPNHMSLFLNMNRRCGDVVNIGRQESLRRNFDKIEPFGLGFDPDLIDRAQVEPGEKLHDIFYAGASHTSTVRQRGLGELRVLKERGWRVYVPEERLTGEDFLRACARSWLVWSPEGQGWDCYRHYEALMLNSVPLINLPTTEHLWPLQHGEHCLHYRPEAGGLIDAVESALKDRERLTKIAKRGRAHVLKHHSHVELVRHVLGKMGVAENELGRVGQD